KHELFHAGQVAENMYFLSSGQMVYIRDDRELPHEPPAYVGPGQWLAEPAMWIKWKHVGQSSSTENCELVLLPCDAAARILSRSNASSYAGARRYAQTFAAYFAKQPDRLSDVWPDMDVIEAMVSTAFIKEERERCCVKKLPPIVPTRSHFGKDEPCHSIVPLTPCMSTIRRL
ncbi:unnamed protein product, partial [Polarella glacialis]